MQQNTNVLFIQYVRGKNGKIVYSKLQLVNDPGFKHLLLKKAYCLEAYVKQNPKLYLVFPVVVRISI